MINISDSILKCCPGMKCEVIHGEIFNGHSAELTTYMNKIADNDSYYSTNIPEIQLTRLAYKECGKEPSRYRPSAESLRMRIRSKKGLYSISSAVDIINIISITSGISIGGYHHSAMQGDITLDIGKTEPYDAIGRGLLNIEFLPCLYDEMGPFGSPTSDSLRTIITEKTTNL